MQNLSFDQDLSLVYLSTRNYKVSGRDNKVLEGKPTANGLISIYRQTTGLQDFLAPRVEKDERGYVKAITITLVVAQFDNKGEISKVENKEYRFDATDFRSWQKASHMQNSGMGKTGVLATLSMANALYYNYKPDQKGSDDIPTPQNPGSINESFAITKCVKHALKKSNLSPNPYAKKYATTAYQHRKFVEEVEDDDVTPDFVQQDPVMPEKPQAKAEVLVEKEVLATTAIKPENLVNPAPSVDSKTPQENLFKIFVIEEEAEACKTKDEVIAVFKKYKDELDANAALKKKITAIGIDRRDNPRTGKTEEKASEAPEEETNLTADNI